MLIRKKVYQKVLRHFGGDETRAKVWFEIPNPTLHGLKPKTYPHKQLERLIDVALEGAAA